MGRGPLVGRTEEVEVLEDALAELRDGTGALVLLVGEPGIGKSRLADELARMAAAGGSAVAWGRAWEAGGAPPFWPWARVLRALDVPEPDIARLLGGREGAAATPEDRFLLFDATTRVLAETTRARPAVVILEDLHAADEASLHLLAFLADQLRGLPLLVLGTYRDVEARRSATAGAILERLARGARMITPRRLGRADIAELAAHPLDDATLAALEAQTEGNPLFVTELLRVLARRGGGPLAIPASVRGAIREHLHHLPPELPPVLELAAVIGREFSASRVAELCGRAPGEVLDALGAAVDLGVLVERAPGRFAFAHGLFAETLHHDLPAARRAELHVAIADALERAYGGDPGAPLAEIAHHLVEAGPAHAARAVAVSIQAAEQARDQLAFEPASALLERALAIAPPGELRARFELLRLLGEVRLLGDALAPGREAAREAAALARSLAGAGSPDGAELLARAALTYGGHWSLGSTDQVLLQLLEEALAALPPGDSALRARMLARLASALQPTRDTGPPITLARQAIAMAERLGDERTRLEVLVAASAALVLFAPPAERRRVDEAALVLAQRLEEPLLALRCHQRLFFDHAELADFAGMETHRRAYVELGARLRLPKARWPAAMMRAMIALLQGRSAEQAEAFEEAARLAAEAGDGFFEVGPRVGHHVLTVLQRDDVAALASDRTVFQFAAWGRGFQYVEVLAVRHARLGELVEARALLTRDALETIRVHGLVASALMAAEVIWRAGDRELAALMLDWFVAEGARMTALFNHGFAFHRPAAHGAMQLAATLGDLAAARRHFEVACHVVRALEARPLEAWLALDFATILVAAGERGDEPRALLARARTLAEACDLALAPRIAAVLAALGDAPASAAPVPAPWDGELLLRCEGELWVLAGLGATCTLKASRGVEMLARLVAEPGRELHALDLSAEGDGAADAGDAGEALDATAKRAYQARVRALQEELAEAEGWNDTGRAERLRDELEALRTELARALGLGGKTRKVGRAAERARINVQRRLADAIRRVGEVSPVLGDHLTRSVRTGTYCSYQPERARR